MLSHRTEFQSTLPRGERRRMKISAGYKPGFQSTLPRGERPYRVLQSAGAGEGFQSTLPRGERRKQIAQAAQKYLISIHAPTRGATYIMSVFHKVNLFQSTLPRGERHFQMVTNSRTAGHFNPRSHEGSDCFVAAVRRKLDDFNPRSHEGSDLTDAEMAVDANISIHAPTRGATC